MKNDFNDDELIHLLKEFEDALALDELLGEDDEEDEFDELFEDDEEDELSELFDDLDDLLDEFDIDE